MRRKHALVVDLASGPRHHTHTLLSVGIVATVGAVGIVALLLSI